MLKITFSGGLDALFPKYLKNSARQNILPLFLRGYSSLFYIFQNVYQNDFKEIQVIGKKVTRKMLAENAFLFGMLVSKMMA